jgi:competence protein ComEA
MSRSDRITVAAGFGALVLAVAAAWLVLSPATPGPSPAGLISSADPLASAEVAHGSHAPGPGGTIVVDVEGAVARPGVQTLPSGSRVADAIAAAGGYAASVDVAAAAAQINLAQLLSDGEQIRVPARGESGTAGVPSPEAEGNQGGSGSSAGLVDLNTASPEELEALPGIGPVTVQQIVAAREERPFSSLQDAVDRGAIDRGQLEQIADLATAG